MNESIVEGIDLAIEQLPQSFSFTTRRVEIESRHREIEPKPFERVSSHVQNPTPKHRVLARVVDDRLKYRSNLVRHRSNPIPQLDQTRGNSARLI
jgi:hypothetical protein